MKKYILSTLLVGAIGTTGLHAAKANNGGFLGLNLGGMITGTLSGSPQLNSSVSVGLRTGYQAFFVENFGARFYASGIAGFGLLSVSTGGQPANGMSVNLGIMADINADMLIDFTSSRSFSAGMYIGFFGGALINTPILQITGQTAKTTVATTVGLNLGARVSVQENHEFDFGVKIGAAFNMDGSSSSLGTAMYAGSAYSYKF